MTEAEADRTPVTLYEEIFPGDTNPYGTAFGGKILALVDRAAGLAASRWAHRHFVTALVDTIVFEAPIHQGEVAEVEAEVVYTTTHTCGVLVRVFALDKTAWQRRRCCDGILLMVAMSSEGKPVAIPPLKPSSAEQRTAWERAAEVHRRVRSMRSSRQQS